MQQQQQPPQKSSRRWRRWCRVQGVKLWRLMWVVQLLLAAMVAVVMLSSIGRLYSSGFFSSSRDDYYSLFKEQQQHWRSSSSRSMGVEQEQIKSLLDNVGVLQPKVSRAMEGFQLKAQQQIQEQGSGSSGSEWLEHSRLLLDVAVFLDETRNTLLRIRRDSNPVVKQDIKPLITGDVPPVVNKQQQEAVFAAEELNKYLLPREHRLGSGRKNFLGTNATRPAIGLACFSAELKPDVEKYMSYDIGDYCPDDWTLGQRLMVHGCDPLPRRRCLARTPQLFNISSSSSTGAGATAALWEAPDDRNVRWSSYRCKSFACLASKNRTGKGFFKCAECFDFTGFEARRWSSGAAAAEFTIAEVVKLVAAGELRIGVDFSVGTGSFAARMREHNVTIVSATLNLGAPFSETIALRGLIPLYLSINQRLPFFDNTMDMVHTTLFLDGWMDHTLLDFVVFDWDRVLRPGGLLWIDRFFCLREDVEEYLYFFLQLRYKKHLWLVAPKLDRRDGKHDEVFFSAVLQKPRRPV